jgi:hypothetical protein
MIIGVLYGSPLLRNTPLGVAAMAYHWKVR